MLKTIAHSAWSESLAKYSQARKTDGDGTHDFSANVALRRRPFNHLTWRQISFRCFKSAHLQLYCLECSFKLVDFSDYVQ